MSLVIGLSTVCLKSQTLENKICLTSSEIDYFLEQFVIARSLETDTFLLNVTIKRKDSLNRELKSNVLDLKSNEKDLKLSLKNQKSLYDNKCLDYDRKLKWNIIYKKIIIVSISAIIIESGFIYLILR